MRNRQINAQDALSFDPLLSYIGASMSTRLSDHNQNWLEALPSSSTSYQWPSKAELQESEETAARRKSSTELRMESDAHDFLWTAGNSPSFSQLLLARSVGRTPRLRYLISYYVEVIAPVIVAFDGPTNPFRTQVLRLAQESESLQEAIATLSTNNMKQRREAKSMATGRTLPSRMSSLAQRALTEDTIEDHHDVYMLEGLSREEQYHRGMAVQALNAQLGDPHRRLSDSVLATLLILCLFHICDTGVAQFKTQFAGIKKLLAIRMRNAGTVTDGLKWYIRLFTWLDTLTATTNDREVELGGTCLDIATVQHEEWGLENLTGCDSKLFKMVAQLGRLNLLSRNQVVRAPTPPDRLSATMTLPASMFQSSFNSTYDVHLPGSEPNSINGFPLPAPGMSLQADQGFSPAFWTEWHSLHQKLESWHISRPNDEAIPSIASQSVNLSYLSPPSSPSSQCHISPENLPDVLNISESFRHAAILYCERLAYPSVPSNHPRIQSMVQAAMRHISAVQSDVFLLWPLFITGSECISEEHRTIIRRRCTDISKDSGFSNNLSCLDLLEKVWQQNADTGGGSAALDGAAGVYGMLDNPILGNMVPVTGVQMNDITGAPGERGFRWNRVMQAKRADGEYMVV